MNNDKTKKLVWAGLFTALTTVATIIPIPLRLSPNGYVNVGDALVIVSAFLLSPAWGALAAGLGAALADVLLSYFVYSPATLVIKALMALAAGFVLRRFKTKNTMVPAALGSITAEIIMVLGYFAYDSLIYGVNGAIADLPGNCIQGAFGAIAGTALFLALLRIPYVKKTF